MISEGHQLPKEAYPKELRDKDHKDHKDHKEHKDRQGTDVEAMDGKNHGLIMVKWGESLVTKW